MRTFLGIDGGGSKTAFLLIDDSGRVLGSHAEGSAYYLEIGWEALRALLSRGIDATLRQAALSAEALDFAFIGLPSYGEDSRLLPALDAIAAPPLMPGRYRCGNDAICGWAGALAGRDGINVICGTGSLAYGEFNGRTARAGGWGELFSDEGSAYWIAREGLNLFSRMSDGRSARGPLYDVLRRHFRLQSDLDLCAAVYGANPAQRSDIAALAPLMAEAAGAGDGQAAALFTRAAAELRLLIEAVQRQLSIPVDTPLTVSYCGGMFQHNDRLLGPLRSLLEESEHCYRLLAPRLSPAAGAALYAARLSGTALSSPAVETLAQFI